jgi:hypothetical protein
MISEHEKHTEFLRRCLRYDESAARRNLAEGLTQIQRNERCVRRAVWLMALLTALAVAGLGHAAILMENFPYGAPQFIVDLLCALGMGSLISLLAFVGLGLVYRKKLDRRREECRQLVAKIMESRLGKPVTTPVNDLRDHRAGDGDGRTVRVANEVNSSLLTIESTARG